MGNCLSVVNSTKIKFVTSMDSTKIEHDSKNLASTQPETTIVQSINYTTINTNREFHNEEKSTYWLPKDEDEQKRLTGVSRICSIS